MRDRAVEQRITTWLTEDTSGHLPDRVLRAVFDETSVMRQQRTVLGIVWPMSFSRRTSGIAFAAAVAAAAVVVLVGLDVFGFRAGSSVGGTGRPFATYESPRYEYSIRYPEHWSVRPATQSLGEHEIPWDYSPSIDRYGAGDGGAGIIVAAEPVAAGITLEQWRSVPLTCGTPTKEERISLGGEPGWLNIYARCYDLFHLWAVAMHDGRVYQVIWLNVPGTEDADRALFDRVLRSFAFTPD